MTEDLPYRPNVGIALFNRDGLVFIGKRAGLDGPHCWQMPQGGIDDGEDPALAAQRELKEETGVPPDLTEPLGEAPGWMGYDFPPEVRKLEKFQGAAGQRQKWFAYRFLGSDSDIKLDAHDAEFDAWRWERLERVPELIIPWKRDVYELVAEVFAPFARGMGPMGA